jgi:hypothetical protein
MTIHAKASSGSGLFLLCGERSPTAATAVNIEDIDCPACLLHLGAARPHYYDAGGLKTIKIIQAKLTSEQFEGFLLGNIIKYACRANHKGAFEADVGKLAEYSEWLHDLENSRES